MAGYQDAGLSLCPMRKGRPHAAGKSLAACDAFDGCTHDRHLPRCKVEHALDRASIPGRAFAFHPAAQTLQHDLGIKGKVGWVHGGYSRPFDGAFLATLPYENERRGNCKAKTRRGVMSLPGKLRLAGRYRVRAPTVRRKE